MKYVLRLKKAASDHFSHGLHRIEPIFHVAYLSAAFSEGHGIYAIMAIALAVVVVLCGVLGDGGGEA